MKNSLTTEFGEGKFEVGDAYIAHDLLGQGPLGIVAAGVETGTGKKVAVKHIRPIAASVVGARHILREIITMRVLRCHPNVRFPTTSPTMIPFVRAHRRIELLPPPSETFRLGNTACTFPPYSL